MAWMLYELSVRLAAAAGRAAVAIGRHDGELARQLRRAATSVPLNLAEGSGRSGQDRRQHYRVALGSAKEVRAALEVAEAIGYGTFAAERELADRVCAMAFRSSR